MSKTKAERVKERREEQTRALSIIIPHCLRSDNKEIINAAEKLLPKKGGALRLLKEQDIVKLLNENESVDEVTVFSRYKYGHTEMRALIKKMKDKGITIEYKDNSYTIINKKLKKVIKDEPKTNESLEEFIKKDLGDIHIDSLDDFILD